MGYFKKGQCWEVKDTNHTYRFYVISDQVGAYFDVRCYAISYLDASRDPLYNTGEIYTMHGATFKKIANLIISSGHTRTHTDGCVCVKCKELFPYAEPNQDDGSFKCYRCRS